MVDHMKSLGLSQWNPIGFWRGYRPLDFPVRFMILPGCPIRLIRGGMITCRRIRIVRVDILIDYTLFGIDIHVHVSCPDIREMQQLAAIANAALGRPI